VVVGVGGVEKGGGAPQVGCSPGGGGGGEVIKF